MNDMMIDESLIINIGYYEELKETLMCCICSNLLNNPVMCSNCETLFCKACIDSWKKKSPSCPMRCPEEKSNICEIHRNTKKTLDGLRLRCKHGCEVPLLSYKDHMKKCEVEFKFANNSIASLASPMKCLRRVSEEYKDKDSALQELERENKILKNKLAEVSAKLEEEILKNDQQIVLHKKEIVQLKAENLTNIIREKERYDELKNQIRLTLQKLSFEMKESDDSLKLNLKQQLTDLESQKQMLNDEYLSLCKNNKDRGKQIGKDEYKSRPLLIRSSSYCLLNTKIENVSSNFEFSNDNNSIQLVETLGHAWVGVACKVPIPPNSKLYEFAIKMESINSKGNVMIGFCIQGTNGDKGFRNTNTSWMAYLNNGLFFNAGDSNSFFCRPNVVKPENGDIVSICIDIENSNLYLKKNGKVISSVLTMNINEIDKLKLVPCIDLTDIGDKITIL